MTSPSVQLHLPGFSEKTRSVARRAPDSGSNVLSPEDRTVHDWYRFVLSFPPHLVREYLQDFQLQAGQVVLDPFCGTGTTLVEAKLHGFESIGIEAHPFSHFASTVKVDWDIDPDVMENDAREIAGRALSILKDQGLSDFGSVSNDVDEKQLRGLDPKRARLLIKNSISPVPLHKTLVLLDCLDDFRGAQHYQHLRLALANALVFSISNLHFGPEVGVGKVKRDTPVVSVWLAEVRKIGNDLRSLSTDSYPPSTVHLADSRDMLSVLRPNSVDAVITSPPYPNEKDYTRTTRLESVLLGFVKSMSELRSFKKGLVRSNTRGVYKDDDDDRWISDFSDIQRIARSIEQRRKELGKTSGFERLYHRVTRLYFGGMARHLASLRPCLRPGARLAYVVGDQASYLRIMIRTGQLLSEIATSLGYEVQRIDLFRKRFATATREELREEVVVLLWKGVFV